MLRRLPRPTDPKLLVGFDTNDDAGVYLLAPELALVQTVDFFTPIVDDPFVFGQIAAANSLSDVYAMGGRPVTALSIVGFPENGEPELLEEILRGGLAKMDEAGCVVVGGHSIRDDDLKFGYAVSGVIHPEKIWRNVGARPGDVLLLTKALGTGLIATALKKGRAVEKAVRAAVESMTRLNREAAEALTTVGARHGVPLQPEGTGATEKEKIGGEPPAVRGAIHAVTDVTGFGLLGHAREMAVGSVVSLEIDHAAVEALPGALNAAREGHLAGGLKNNREFIRECVEFAASVPEEFRALLFDPQTSGGLLAAVTAEAAEATLSALSQRGVQARVIGRVVEKRSPLMRVI